MKSQVPESRAVKMLREVFDSGRPLTYLLCTEEQRAARVLGEVSRRLSSSVPTSLWTWSLTEGMHCDGRAADASTRDPRTALDFIINYKDAGIFHLKDFHEPLRDSAEIRRRLRDFYESCLDQQKFVVITSPVRFIPRRSRAQRAFCGTAAAGYCRIAGVSAEETQRMSSGEGNDISEEAPPPIRAALCKA